MPDLNSAAISQLSTIASEYPGVAGNLSQLGNNIQQDFWNQRQEKRQYKNQLDFWNRQNAYNTPAAQMQRFKEAGLNPNLIYGQGNAGNATPLSAPSQGSFHGADSPTRPDLMAAALAAANTRVANAQADNLKVQNEVILQDAALRKLQVERGGFDLDLEREARPFTLGTRQTTAERGKFDLDFLRDTRDYSADMIREHARQIGVQTDLSIKKDVREQVELSSNVNEAIERIYNMRSQQATSRLERAKLAQEVRLLKSDQTLKDWEVKLSTMNVTPHDGLWQRIIGSYISDHLGPNGTRKYSGIGNDTLPLHPNPRH